MTIPRNVINMMILSTCCASHSSRSYKTSSASFRSYRKPELPRSSALPLALHLDICEYLHSDVSTPISLHSPPATCCPSCHSLSSGSPLSNHASVQNAKALPETTHVIEDQEYDTDDGGSDHANIDRMACDVSRCAMEHQYRVRILRLTVAWRTLSQCT